MKVVVSDQVNSLVFTVEIYVSVNMDMCYIIIYILLSLGLKQLIKVSRHSWYLSKINLRIIALLLFNIVEF